MQKFFVLFFDYRPQLELLSNAQRGELLLALFDYAQYGKKPHLDQVTNMAFSFIAAQINRDKQKYEEKCQKGRKNAQKRWSAECQPIPSHPNTKEKENTKDKTNTKEKEKKMDFDLPSPFEEQVFSLYHHICISFPPCMAITEGRRKAIQNLHKKGFGLEEFKQVFEAAQQSSFLKGKNSRKWTAGFDWIIDETNIAKVLEGNYNDAYSQDKPSYDLEELAQFGMHIPEL